MITIPEVGYVKIDKILAVFPVSRSAFWAGVKSGKYPRPYKLSARCTAWRAEDIHALLASYKQEGDK
ncbi:phage transcriptional regulator AlpA [Legionella cincinnatiensis]|uniref:Phage transcriptional regulator AlpA n=1 Tax=Legionella cincinnatiensis TaxID=28085 RepID=A0A378IPR2_9GAMM|nr:AlpA family phage regulatory protein [Legionella cincinnatiensis]KTC93373.1 Prophage CP4-57 regulatory protein (AlpA) [Legionella cincinnatiensis]STX36625.1 phage transcriptional regulator AlpA [Legionella cincinnatiensis]